MSIPTISADGFKAVDGIDWFGSRKDPPGLGRDELAHIEGLAHPERIEGLDGTSLFPQTAIRVKKTEVFMFDMMDEKDRKRYAKAYTRFVNLAAAGKGILDSRKDVLARADGSTSLFKFLEFSELEQVAEDAKGDRQT